jgi:hypothetical protein
MESNPPELPQGVLVLLARGAQTLGKETSEYQEEEKSIEIPLVGATQTGIVQTESLPERAGRCGVRLSICNPEVVRPNLPGKADKIW